MRFGGDAMPTQWYYWADGKPIGPISSDRLLALARAGQIQPETPVQTDLTGKPVAARMVSGLFKTSAERGAAASGGGAIPKPPPFPAATNRATPPPLPRSAGLAAGPRPP